MKKLLSILIVLFIATGAYAQSHTSESSSKTLQFLEAGGSFMVKEFYDLATVKGVDCKVLIITDAVSEKKIGCMRLETKDYSSATRSTEAYVGTLDSDELDACIQSLSYMKDSLLPSPRETYTEAEYRTRDKVTIGAYFDTHKLHREYPQGHRPALPGRPEGRTGRHQGNLRGQDQAGACLRLPRQTCRSQILRPGLWLRQFSHRIIHLAPTTRKRCAAHHLWR